MRAHHLPRLRHTQLTVVVKEAVQRFEHVRWSKVELVENEPVALADSLHEHARLESEATALSLDACVGALQ